MFSLHVNKENSYELKQEVFLDQCCLHLVKWSIDLQHKHPMTNFYQQRTVSQQ